MQVGVLGINYKSSDLCLRELLAKAARKSFHYESWKRESLFFVVLSTCNRTEIYFSAEDLAQAHGYLLAALREEVHLPFEHRMYSYFGVECFYHLAEVTTGLDSIILGESEIQRQVKQSYETASLHQELPSCLHFMFQKCLKIGKEARSKAMIPTSLATIERAVFTLIENFFGTKNPSLLFVGHSEINRKMISYLKSKGYNHLTMATRSISSAKELLEKNQMRSLEWQEISSWKNYEVVICGTNQKEYLLDAKHIISFSEEIRNRLIIDLSMPRSVDPYLSRHTKISLFNIEEIFQLVEQKQKLSQDVCETVKDKIGSLVQNQWILYGNKKKKRLSCVISPASL